MKPYLLLVFMLAGCCRVVEIKKPIPQVTMTINGVVHTNSGSQNYPKVAVICGGGYTDKNGISWDWQGSYGAVTREDECCYRPYYFKLNAQSGMDCKTCSHLDPPIKNRCQDWKEKLAEAEKERDIK